MSIRWMLAAGAALALGLLTLPAIRSVTVESPVPGGGGEVAEAAETAAACDDDARPAPLDFTISDMNGNEVDLYTSRRGSWTLVERRAGGLACVHASGTGWHVDMRALGIRQPAS